MSYTIHRNPLELDFTVNEGEALARMIDPCDGSEYYAVILDDDSDVRANLYQALYEHGTPRARRAAILDTLQPVTWV